MQNPWLEKNLPTVEEIRRRLALIIPGAQDPHGFGRRELAAKTVFVMLYGFAVEGFNYWIRPTAVTDMTDIQASRQEPNTRRKWLASVQGKTRPRSIEERWYSENTRESIRDETLRSFVELGVVVERAGLPTTSPKPRYALSQDFTSLLSPGLSGESLRSAIEDWQERHLSSAALARLILLRKGAAASGERVLIALPNGEKRRLAPGPSSELTRAAIEQFAPRFLGIPAVVMISESAQKLGYQDEEVSKAIGFEIDVSKALPDAVLADLDADPPLIVFIECVVTDGPVNERRKRELEEIAAAGGFRQTDCAFVTVFHDRERSPYRGMATSLAWGTFAWFETEPDHIVFLRSGGEERMTSLHRLLRKS